jgi:short-subunit dehydrogenase
LSATSYALITGASSGIGLELARIFAANRIPMVLVARRRHKLEELAQELKRDTGTEVLLFPCDLSLSEAAVSVSEFCRSNGLRIGYLVNNAGFGDYGTFAESDLDKLRRMIAVNIDSLTALTHLFLPEMLAKKEGKILNVSSMAAFLPGPQMAVYYATKAFVLHFSEALSAETAGTGVTVTALCPGPTHSGFYDAAGMDGIRLFRSGRVAASRSVARYGYRALMRGKRVAVYDRLNSLMTATIGWFPRSWVLRVAGYLNTKSGGH